MSDRTPSDSGGNNTLYFIVGGLVVFAIVAFLFFGGYIGGDGPGTSDTNITIETPRTAPPATTPATPAR